MSKCMYLVGLWLGGLMASSVLPVQAEIIPGDLVRRGTVMAPQQCAAIGDAVWVQIAQHGICMRYYISTVGGSGPIAIVHLSGDIGGVPALHPNVRSRSRSQSRRNRSGLPRARSQSRRNRFGFSRARSRSGRAQNKPTRDRDTRQLLRRADDLSRQTGTTGIHLARMGMDGSSGQHYLRRTYLELYATNAALDLLKQRYGFRGFHLVGQSGGATLIGALVAMRNDIVCAVPGSGRLAMLTPAQPMQDRYLNRIDPVGMLANIVRNRSSRIMVVTDPQDRVVPREHQDTYVQRVWAAGRSIEQYYVTSTARTHHGVLPYAIFVASACAQGQSYDQISRALSSYVAERVQRARGRDDRQRQWSGNPYEQESEQLDKGSALSEHPETLRHEGDEMGER